MITLVFVAACFLMVIALMKKRSLERQRRDRELRYYFVKSSLEFLVPLSIALAFYVGLWAVISLGWERLSLQSLISLEGALATIHSYLANVKLSEFVVLLGFVAIYLLGLPLLPWRKQEPGVKPETREKLYAGFGQFHKWTKRLYTLFVLLCSFTLLGTQLGAPSDELKLRIKLTRDGYADLQQQAQEAVAEEVAGQLHDKVQQSFPPAYHEALKLPEKIGAQANTLRDYYAGAQREHQIKSSKAETVLAAIATRNKTVAGLPTEGRSAPATGAAPAKVDTPEQRQVSYRQINQAKTALENYRQKAGNKMLTFLNTEEGKRLAVQAPKAISDLLKSELVRSLIKAYPIAEPMVDVLADTIDEKVQAKVEKAVDNATRSLVQNPERAEAAVKSEAAAVADQTPVKQPPAAAEKAAQAGRQLQQELASVEAARAEVESGVRQAEQRKSESLIAQLKHPKESVRDSAASGLSQMGNKLSQAQVNKLVGIMRHGQQRWSKFLYRESHCSWYEYTSVKYYAATALAGMNSPHVNQTVVSEARRSQDSSKRRERVTDPGWI